MNTKNWQVNVVVTYWSNVPNTIYRKHIHNTLVALSFLYKVDLRLSFDYKFDPTNYYVPPRIDEHSFDLFYFRSQSQSKLSAREFRKLLRDIFDKALNPLLGGVELDYMTAKATEYYPFPLNEDDFS